MSKIILIGQDLCLMKEATGGGAITPGHVVTLNSSNALVVRAASVKKAPLRVAMQGDFYGRTIDTAWAANDLVPYATCPTGVEFNGLTAADAVTIAIGDLLKPVNGTLVVIGADEEALAVAIARSAVSKGGSTPSVRVRAEAL